MGKKPSIVRKLFTVLLVHADTKEMIKVLEEKEEIELRDKLKKQPRVKIGETIYDSNAIKILYKCSLELKKKFARDDEETSFCNAKIAVS